MQMLCSFFQLSRISRLRTSSQIPLGFSLDYLELSRPLHLALFFSCAHDLATHNLLLSPVVSRQANTSNEARHDEERLERRLRGG